MYTRSKFIIYPHNNIFWYFFPFGSSLVYLNLKRSIFDDKKFVEVYLSKDAEKLGIGLNEKIALAMLLGGDYTEGVRGVGKETLITKSHIIFFTFINLVPLFFS